MLDGSACGRGVRVDVDRNGSNVKVVGWCVWEESGREKKNPFRRERIQQ